MTITARRIRADRLTAHIGAELTGIDLADDRRTVPIGAGCKVCPRPACPQRAFPQVGRPIDVDVTVSDSVPYRPARTG